MALVRSQGWAGSAVTLGDGTERLRYVQITPGGGVPDPPFFVQYGPSGVIRAVSALPWRDQPRAGTLTIIDAAPTFVGRSMVNRFDIDGPPGRSMENTYDIDSPVGRSMANTFDVEEVADSDYPNQPAGFTAKSDNNLSGTNGLTTGWSFKLRGGSYRSVSDATAPQSAPQIGRAVYQAGFEAGSEPFTLQDFGIDYGSAAKLYVAIWVRFSSAFEGHPGSGVTKILHLWTHTKNIAYTAGVFSGTTQDIQPQIRLQPTPALNRNLPPNMNGFTSSSRPMVRDTWYQLETLLEIPNPITSPTGRAHMWLRAEGDSPVKVIEYTDVVFGASSQSRIWRFTEWAPTWGGIGGAVTTEQYMDIDHIYVAVAP